MRLKSFRAPTMTEAMALVRDHFGDDAVIVSTHQGPGEEGVRVTAAVDDVDIDPELGDKITSVDALDAVEAVSQSLDFHGVPPALADRLVDTASNLLLDDPAAALAVALDAALSFEPLATQRPDRPLMLVGPPGTGKTVTLAKLAVRATFARQPISVITTDVVRAGGVDQLAAFTRLLKIGLKTAEDPVQLRAEVAATGSGDLVLIDSVATNPFSDTEMTDLVGMVRATGAEPVLVLNAGMEREEAEETARIFRRIGCTRLVVTRIDVARRFGSMLAAAYAARLKLSDMTSSPHVTQGIAKVTPMTLAKLLLPNVTGARDGGRIAMRTSLGGADAVPAAIPARAQPPGAAAAAAAAQAARRVLSARNDGGRPAPAAARERSLDDLPLAERIAARAVEIKARQQAEQARRAAAERAAQALAAPQLPDAPPPSLAGERGRLGPGQERPLPERGASDRAPDRPEAERSRRQRLEQEFGPAARPLLSPERPGFEPPPRFLFEPDPVLDNPPPLPEPEPPRSTEPPAGPKLARRRDGGEIGEGRPQRVADPHYAERAYAERQSEVDRSHERPVNAERTPELRRAPALPQRPGTPAGAAEARHLASLAERGGDAAQDRNTEAPRRAGSGGSAQGGKP